MKNIPLRKLKSSQSEPLLSGHFTIRDIKQILAGGHMHQSLHRHDYFFILLLEKGRGKHEIDFIKHTVSDYSIFLMRPGQVHQLTLDAGSVGFLLEFRPEFYLPKDKLTLAQWRRLSSLGKCKLNSTTFRPLKEILSAVLKEYASRQEGYQDAIRAYLDLFFIALLRQRGAGERTSVSQSYNLDQSEKFLDLLETHISTEKQTGQYAKMMSLSPYQLNAITRNTLGKTASELINEHIVLEARRYLLATTSQVSQISYELGYEDVSYFIRFFKKHTGYTPEAYRRQFS